MERFSATVSIEELKAKVKKVTRQNAHASGSVYIFLRRNLETTSKKLKGWSLADWTRFYNGFMQK